MNTFLSRLLPLTLAGLLSLPAAAQKYRTALGVRLGSGNTGFTAQQRVAEKVTVEGLLLLRSREITGGLLLERHFHLLGPSLNYYFGAGGHVGRHLEYGTVGGLDGLAGLEWKLPIVRLLVSADVKPSLEFNNDEWLRFPTAVSVRYIIVRDRGRGFMGRLLNGDDDGRRKNKGRKESQNSRPGLLNGL